MTASGINIVDPVSITLEPNPQPRSVQIAERGIQTSREFANVMAAIMSDVGSGRLTPQVGNAMVNAGGKLLKVVEMQLRYGTSGPGQEKVLRLSDGNADMAA